MLLAGVFPSPPGHLHPVPDGTGRVQGRPHVQDGKLVVVGVDIATIVIVNYISGRNRRRKLLKLAVGTVTHKSMKLNMFVHIPDFLPTSVNDPIVPVKGQLIAQPGSEPGPG